MKRLQKCLDHIAGNEIPADWYASRDRIKCERSFFLSLLAQPSSRMYGANTRVGHRDTEVLSEAEIQKFNTDFLSSHTIGVEPWYSKYETACINYAKAYSLAAGGTGISLKLYDIILRALNDVRFTPKIPKDSSYSCGDVIPGSHWADSVLQYAGNNDGYDAGPGEVMALVNGSFIHVGYSISLVRKISFIWILFLETTKLNNILVGANKSNFYTPLVRHKSELLRQYLEKYVGSKYSEYERQNPISIRSTPQLLDSLTDSTYGFLLEIDNLIELPSSNPLYFADFEFPLSQSSFLAPSLSIKAGALIESILMFMWASVSRTKYLLSGAVQGIPSDGAHAHNALQFIQYPKLMQSILEKSRQLVGRRIFASGSDTSQGVEDLWTYGVNVCSQLEDLYQNCAYLLSLELYINVTCCDLFSDKKYENNEINEYVLGGASLGESIAKIRLAIEAGTLSDAKALFAECIGLNV